MASRLQQAGRTPLQAEKEYAMNRQYTHPDDDAIALLARALTPIFAAALAQAANEPASGHDARPAAADGDGELPRAA